jgi:hypothetical protein
MMTTTAGAVFTANKVRIVSGTLSIYQQKCMDIHTFARASLSSIE